MHNTTQQQALYPWNHWWTYTGEKILKAETEKDFTGVCPPIYTTTVLDVNNFQMFIKDVYNLFDNPKYAINTLIGIFGHNYKSKIYIILHRLVLNNRLVQ